MLRKICFVAGSRLLFAFVLLGIGSTAFGQGSTFTYQGRLTDGGTPPNGTPANGTYITAPSQAIAFRSSNDTS